MLDAARLAATNTDNISASQAVSEIRHWTDLSEGRRRDLLSAISRCVTFIGLPADAVFLDPAALRQSLFNRSPAAMGIKTGSWRTLKSCLSYVMSRLGIIDTERAAPGPGWAELLSDLDPRKRAALSAFCRYCAASGHEPRAVSDATLVAFKAWLEARTICTNPTKRAGQVRAEWNRIAKSNPELSIQSLRPMGKKDQYTLPLEAFPASFQEDVLALGRRLAAASLDGFDDLPIEEPEADNCRPALSKPCRASTVENRMGHCRWAASALVAAGTPIGEIRSLTSLVNPIGNARTILRFYYRKYNRQPSATGGRVADVLRIIAKYDAGLPESDLKKICKWGSDVRLKYNGMTRKNSTHIRQMQHPEREARLLLLPQSLMDVARKLKEHTPKAAAGVAMRAVAIGLLTGIPIRLKNLISLRLDEHLQRDDYPHGLISRLWIPEQETKNRRLLDLPVSPRIAALLQEWITVFRPSLAQTGCTFLFPGGSAATRPITPQGMRDAIRETMKSKIGVALTPHQFRHLAAATFLRDHPGCFEEVRQLLGHADIKTTIKAYCGTETERAVLRYHDVLESRMAMSGHKGIRNRGGSNAHQKAASSRSTKRGGG
jgi:integrase